MRQSAFALAALLVLVPGPASSCAAQDAPPPPVPDDAAYREAKEAAAKALAAAAEAGRAAEDAARARRLALLDAVRAQEELLAILREQGREAEIAEGEGRLRDLYGRIGASAPGVQPRAPAAVPGTVRTPAPPARPFPAAEGLQLLRARPGAQSEASVIEPALDWLARHQSPGGNWDGDGFGARCRDGKCPGPGGPLYDPGVTGLATLAFLGAGETHKTPKHGETVREALEYLKAVQDAEGCFGPRVSGHFVYNQALGTLVFAEAYGLTQSPLFKDSAQRGVDFILSARNPYMAWRYGVKPQDNDTSVTTWMVMALKSAKSSGLAVDEDAFRGALAWLDKVTEPEYGRVGYSARGNGPARPQELMDRFPPDRSESLTAAGVLARTFCGADLRTDESIRKGADLCLRTLPRWDEAAGTIDYYYWYFGTLSMFQVGGDHWKRWDAALGEALLPYQRGDSDGCARGSWDPVDPWGQDGGRVYSTALGAMMSEVHFRHGRAFGGR